MPQEAVEKIAPPGTLKLVPQTVNGKQIKVNVMPLPSPLRTIPAPVDYGSVNPMLVRLAPSMRNLPKKTERLADDNTRNRNPNFNHDGDMVTGLQKEAVRRLAYTGPRAPKPTVERRDRRIRTHEFREENPYVVPTNKHESLDGLKQYGSWENYVWRNPQTRQNMRRAAKEVSQIPGARVGPVAAMASALPIAYALPDGTIQLDEVVTAPGGVQDLPGRRSDFEGLLDSTLSDEVFPIAFPPSSNVRRAKMVSKELSRDLAREFLETLWIGAASANVPRTAKTAKAQRPLAPERAANKRSNTAQSVVPKPSLKQVKNRLSEEASARPHPASQANVPKGNTSGVTQGRQHSGRSIGETEGRPTGATQKLQKIPEKRAKPTRSKGSPDQAANRVLLPSNPPRKINMKPL